MPEFLFRHKNAVALLTLWIFTGIAYSNSFQGTYIFDDSATIVENTGIRSFATTLDPSNHPIPLGLYRRDLVRWSLALNYAISGYNTWSYHALNLLIHLAAGSILFYLVCETIAKSCSELQSHAYLIAFCSALLWLLHPLQTESVTYIIQRLESFSSLWYLLILYCVNRSANESASRLWQFFAVFSMAAGVYTKEIIVTAPFVALLYDRIFLARSFKEIASKRAVLYVGLFSGIGLLFANYQSYRQLSQSEVRLDLLNMRAQPVATRWQYLSSQPGVILHYIWLALVPVNQCLDYLWPIANDSLEIYGKGFIVLAVIGLGCYLCSRRSAWGFLILSFFFILAPTSSLKPLLLAFEHRMYLPLACIITGLVALTFLLADRFAAVRAQPDHDPAEEDTTSNSSGKLATTIVCILAIALLGLTYERNKVYHSRVSLWRDVTIKRPENPRGWENLGKALHEADANDPRAIESVLKATEINPEYGMAWKNLGTMLMIRGRTDEAALAFAKGAQLVPDSLYLQEKLAEALANIGRFEAAIQQYEIVKGHKLAGEVLKMACTTNQGIAYVQLGQHKQAETCFIRAMSIDPTYPATLMAYAKLSIKTESYDRARDLFRQAKNVEQNNASIPFLEAEMERKIGNQLKAMELYQDSLRRDASFFPAASMLGLELIQIQEFQKAIDVLHPFGETSLAPDSQADALALLIHCCDQLQQFEQKAHYQKLANRILPH